jgi:hypothetical protein
MTVFVSGSNRPSPSNRIEMHPAGNSLIGLGFEEMEAKPLPFSREISPPNTSVHSLYDRMSPWDRPTMTPSWILNHPFTHRGEIKSFLFVLSPFTKLIVGTANSSRTAQAQISV